MINVDVNHQISAVARTVGRRVLPAGEARIVTVSQTYAASIEDVWDACTNPERIPRWFLPVSGELKVGGHYQLEGNAGGTVERCTPPTAFDATWEMGGEVSWVELRLSVLDDESTRFELTHVAHVSDERWAEFGPGAVGVGWDMALVGLGFNVAGAGPIDPADGMAWAGSDAGREFIRRSSQAWCDASVAEGTPRLEAEAAARGTTSAYTGEA